MPRSEQFSARIVAQRIMKTMMMRMKFLVLGLAALIMCSVSAHGQGTCNAP